MFKITSTHLRLHRNSNSICTTMNDSVPLVLKLIAATIPVADKAGKIIRDVMKSGDLNIVHKGVADYQTEADRSAQQCIISSLVRQFPKIHIVGEEGTSLPNEPLNDTQDEKLDEEILKHDCPEHLKDVKEEQITVWVDPLDGTSEYTQGLLEHVTTLIGIAVDEKAIAGVIHQPYYGHKENPDTTGRTIWGLIGLGAFGLQLKEPPKGKKIVATTRSHSNKIVLAAVDAIKPDSVIKVGGSGHKVLILMEGQAHAYVFASRGTKRWDTCAPEAVLHAAGGQLTDMNGNIYKYDKDTPHENFAGILATYKKEEHSAYLNSIPQEIKNSFQ